MPGFGVTSSARWKRLPTVTSGLLCDAAIARCAVSPEEPAMPESGVPSFSMTFAAVLRSR